jgi:DNA polymerase-3 subunit epsilon
MALRRQPLPLPQLRPAGATGFAVLALETTGTDQLRRIVEITLVLLSPEGESEQEWRTVINPGVPIPNGAVHCIDERLAAAAPSFAAVAPTLAALLEGRVLVAHNLVLRIGVASKFTAHFAACFIVFTENLYPTASRPLFRCMDHTIISRLSVSLHREGQEI